MKHLEPRIEFLDALRAADIVPSDPNAIVADGELHRFHVEGDKCGSQNGWFVLHAVPTAGAFGHWRTGGETHRWRGGACRLSLSERDRMRNVWARAKCEREAKEHRAQRAAQIRAQERWHAAAEPIQSHPYLVAKGVKAYGIRQRDHLLLIPMRDATGELWGVQTIAPDGAKRFASGSRTRGLFHLIGEFGGDVLGIGEGYASTASIYEATGYPIAVAYSASNLEAVAIALRKKYCDARIFIFADNDAGTEARTGKNPGRFYAERAARAVGGTVVLPEFAK